MFNFIKNMFKQKTVFDVPPREVAINLKKDCQHPLESREEYSLQKLNGTKLREDPDLLIRCSACSLVKIFDLDQNASEMIDKKHTVTLRKK